jgi:hypothetical protein
LLFSTTSFGLLKFAALRGLSHDTEPFAEAAVAKLAGLWRPSFGDLARVGGICKTKTHELVESAKPKHQKLYLGAPNLLM